MSTALLDLDELTINGQGRRAHAKLMDAITGLSMVETITGASTVTVTVQDVDRKLLRSELLKETTTLVLDGAGFELCQVKKSGSGLTLTFEDIAIAKLRKDDSFRKVAAGAMSRAEFVRLLVHERPWIHFVDAPGPKAKVELSRGKQATTTTSGGADGFQASALGGGLTDTPAPKNSGVTTKTTGEDKKESTWDAATRIMGEIQWRVFARRSTVFAVPDSYLLGQDPYKLTESSAGVDDIDFDWDIGKPAATASLTVRTLKRDLQAGSAVKLTDMGIGDGNWIVEEINRTAASKTASVKLLRPQPTLPEPVDTSGAGDLGEDGFDASVLGGGVSDGIVGPVDRVHAGLGSSAANAPAKVIKFVETALAQRGKRYVWGTSGPNTFDCSGLVTYCAHQAGVPGIHQPVLYLHKLCVIHHGLIPVPQAISTYGAILMRVTRGGTNHVAISLGNGKTIEAMGRAYGVRIGNAKGRFDRGGLLPGMWS